MRPSLPARLRYQLALMGLALQCLTRLAFPVLSSVPPAWPKRSTAYFPLVGALIGLLSGLVLAAASAWWPPTVAVGVSMAFSAWLTRAIHEHSWAHIGAPLGAVFALGLKAAVLVALVSPQFTELNDAQNSHVHRVLLVWAWMGLIWCHAASRLVPVLIGALLPTPSDAPHTPSADRIDRSQALAALGTTFSVWLAMWLWMWLSGWPTGTLMQAMAHSTAGLAMGGVAMGLWLLRHQQRHPQLHPQHHAPRHQSNFTAHGLGAAQQLSELAGLMGWLMVIRP
jgi:adenosylcobinamide-GDP ribazoletransferase